MKYLALSLVLVAQCAFAGPLFDDSKYEPVSKPIKSIVADNVKGQDGDVLIREIELPDKTKCVLATAGYRAVALQCNFQK